MVNISARKFTPSSTERTGLRLKPWTVVLGLLALVIAAMLWFLFTSKSVQIKFAPAAESVSIKGGFSFELGGVWLLREGRYQLQATAPLHEPLEIELVVGGERNQQVSVAFTPLPGTLFITTTPADAQIVIDGESAAEENTLSAGWHEVSVSHPRYQPHTERVEIVGKLKEQQLEISLTPNWAEIEIVSTPAGASVLIDGERWGEVTPTTIEALAGERLVEIRMDGYKTHRQRLFAKALDRWQLEPVRLVQADAQLEVSSVPSGAGVLIGGAFQGRTPLLLDLKSGVSHKLQIVSAGFADYNETLRLERGQQAGRDIRLQRLTGRVTVTVEPETAEVYINGELQSGRERAFNLPITAHDFRITLDGYAPYAQTITPKNGLVQEIRVKLLTHEEARLAAMKPSITAPDGQSLKLFSPYGFTMGASRREPGRRANETLREVNMTRFFYLATHETTNAQFRKFASGHDSGKFVDTTLNDDEQPVASVGWHEAAAYCNWLSKQQQLTPFYNIEYGKVVSTNPRAKGYRLPTEAEWAWAARTLEPDAELLKFPWGDNLPPPDRHGNYADRAASNLVGRIIFGYNDNYPVAAPVGAYKPNHRGLFDLGGNVAEWTNDFYEIPDPEPVTDPTGPDSGEYHVIKGSSWRHGTVTELRLSFRDYGIDARNDVGFRIARSAE